MLTDEQIQDIWAGASDPYDDDMSVFNFARVIEAEVRTDIEAAVLAEREQCALLADKRYAQYGTGGMDYKFMANAIRARTQPLNTDDVYEE